MNTSRPLQSGISFAGPLLALVRLSWTIAGVGLVTALVIFLRQLTVSLKSLKHTYHPDLRSFFFSMERKES